MLMNGKEVNNLILAGQRFSAVKSTLIGAKVQTKKGQKVYYVGNVNTTSAGQFSIGSAVKDEIVPIKQCLYLIKTDKFEDGEYWIQIGITFSDENNKVIYSSTPCYIRLSDITLKSEVGGVNSPTCLLIIYNMREVAPSC